MDVDEAGISISKTALTIGESWRASDVRTHFTVALASKPTANVTVTVTGGSLSDARVCLSGGGCAPSKTLTFTPGDWSTAQTVAAQGVLDELDEGDEQVTFTLDPASAGDGVHDGLASATLPVTIEDDDDPPALSVSAPSVTEGDSGEATLTWKVTLSPIRYCFAFLANGTCDRYGSQVGVSGREVTLDYTDAGTGTAAAGTDYTAFAAGTLTIAAGTTDGGTIEATVKGDRRHEADETVVLSLSDPGNAALAVVAGQTADTATGAITDDDPVPKLSISPTARATEGDGGSGVPATLTWTVTLNPESGREATVAWADAGTGTATSGVDYATVAGGTLTFAAGETRKTVAATVTGDRTDEADETVIVKLSAPTNAVLAVVAAGRTADTGTGRIRDDDAPPVLSFSAPTASEGDSGPTTVSFEVESSAESGKVVTVDYADAGTGTAESGTDYTALAAGTLTIAAGDTTATVGVQVTGDTVNEPDETIVLKLSGAVNATLAVVAGQTADTGAITIDDDDAATATLALTPDSISENGGLSTVTATLAVPSSAVVTIAVSAAPGAGAAAGDFTLSADRTLTFAEGATTSAGLVTVTANADTTDSPNKGVTVSGAASGGHRMADPADATLTIEDDDAAPQVALAVAPSTIDESGANSVATVTATLSHPSSAPTTVTVAAAAALGSNTNAADFALSTATTLTIAAGADGERRRGDGGRGGTTPTTPTSW